MAREQHPLEVHGIDTILDDGVEVHEKTMRDLLTEILRELKQFNIHMQLITDEEIDNDY